MNTKPRNFRVIEHIYPEKRVFYGQYQVKLLGVKFWFYMKNPVYYKHNPGEKLSIREEIRAEYRSFEEAELALRTRFPEVKIHKVKSLEENDKPSVTPMLDALSKKYTEEPKTSADKLIEDLKGGSYGH